MIIDRTEKKILSETYVFQFGKHSGETMDDVIETDASYVLWCIKNIDWFKVSKKLLNKIMEMDDRQTRNWKRISGMSNYHEAVHGDYWDTSGISEADFMGW